MKIFKKILASSLAAVLFASGLILLNAGRASAALPYNPSDLISDSIFTNSSSMTASSIQSFLNSENSGLKNYSTTESCSPTTPVQPYAFTYFTHCGKKESVATLIYDAGRAYGINPQAIMATMQKEQSLITDPSPASSQINCAMGYASCASNYTGFFKQLDDGTWQFREYIETMNGDTWWGETASNYPCRNASSLYNKGLLPGNTVKFADPGGKAETVTLDDSATAALYCYTPYVGPFSTTGYSGSYNFVQSFEQWFGSTVYSWAGEVTATTYSDPGYTQQLSLSSSFPSGRKIYVKVSAVNTGSETWKQSFTRIGTINHTNRSSVFADNSWLSPARPAQLMQSSVAPNSTGTFEFSMTMPNVDGEYHEDFSLVAEGIAWMKDSPSFGFDITVSNPYNGSINSTKAYTSSSLSKQALGSIMNPGQTLYWQTKAKNIGTSAWSNSFTKLATINPDNRSSVFHNNSWPSTGRLTVLSETSVAPGSTGTFNYSLTAPSTIGQYSEGFGLVAENLAWMPDAAYTSNIKVASTTDTLGPGQKLQMNQAVYSQDLSYELVMQSDGNFVIYSPIGAAWSTHTNKKAKFAVMQTDGNLVLYSSTGKAVWASNTAHKGSSYLKMQTDGNLVIYTSVGNHVTWDTRTAGNL